MANQAWDQRQGSKGRTAKVNKISKGGTGSPPTIVNPADDTTWPKLPKCAKPELPAPLTDHVLSQLNFENWQRYGPRDWKSFVNQPAYSAHTEPWVREIQAMHDSGSEIDSCGDFQTAVYWLPVQQANQPGPGCWDRKPV